MVCFPYRGQALVEMTKPSGKPAELANHVSNTLFTAPKTVVSRGYRESWPVRRELCALLPGHALRRHRSRKLSGMLPMAEVPKLIREIPRSVRPSFTLVCGSMADVDEFLIWRIV